MSFIIRASFIAIVFSDAALFPPSLRIMLLGMAFFRSPVVLTLLCQTV